MSPEQFAYWLQGFAELDGGMPSEAQWASIKEHLNLVFKKVTSQQVPYQMPSIGTPRLGDLNPGQMPAIIC